MTQTGQWSQVASENRRKVYIETLEATGSEELAIEAAEISKQTPKQWWKRYPELRARREAVLLGKARDHTLGVVEGFPAEDFLRFRELCCAYYSEREKRYVRATNSWYQQDAYSQLQGHNRLVVVMPPGHIKTTFFAIEYVVWRIMRDRNVRITVLQKNADEASKLVQAVAQRLTDHDYYDHLRRELIRQGDEPIVNPLDSWFAKKPFQPKSKSQGDVWGKHALKVAGRTTGEKDYTLEAKGPGGQIQGVRADLFLIDDLQDPSKAVIGDSDAKKLAWLFNSVVMGRVTDYQQVVVLANYFAPDDFAHQVIEEHPDFSVVEYPALIDATVDPSIPAGEVQPLCPEYWTTDALAIKRKDVGEMAWFYTWMQESGSYDEATFKRDVLESSRVPDFALGEVPHPVTDVFIGVDPAVAASGYCAIVAWGIDRRTKQRYLIDVFNKKGLRTWDNVIAQIVDMARAYSPRKVIIELANTQGSLAYNPTLEREIRNLGSRIEVYKTMTGTGARAEQSNFDITTIGGLFDAGLVTLPGGGSYEDQARVQAYIDQLVKWRTTDEGTSMKHLTRDMVMATLFAESEAFELARKADQPQHRKRRQVPKWATNREGGWSWQRPKPKDEDDDPPLTAVG